MISLPRHFAAISGYACFLRLIAFLIAALRADAAAPLFFTVDSYALFHDAASDDATLLPVATRHYSCHAFVAATRRYAAFSGMERRYAC